jgi:hypothetical protein
LDMPNAANDLKTYSLDTTNPPYYRMDALHILLYLRACW